MKRYYDSDKNRLVYIGQESNPEMWDDRWEKEDLIRLFSHNRNSMENEFILSITSKYLHDRARILEGGCGLGDKVFILMQSGYEVIGVDYAAKTVEKLNDFMPELDIRYGDLRQLSFPDHFFDAYWSFGVIEHSYDGPDQMVGEMFRVLKPMSYLFMTVPAMSRLRRMKAALGAYPGFNENSVDTSRFYQYAYDPEEIQRVFCGYGFELIEKQGWSVYKGVRDEIPGTHMVMSLLCRYLGKPTWHLLKNYCNHSCMYVFRKGTSSCNV